MIEAVLDTQRLEEKLKIFSSGLGNIFQELMAKVGEKLVSEAKSNAPRRTGKLANSINFILTKDNVFKFTTRKNSGKSGAFYSLIREHGADIEAKKADYLVFKIDGEWKKVKSVRTPAQPFMKPVFNRYFDDGGEAYTLLAEELQRKINEEFN